MNFEIFPQVDVEKARFNNISVRNGLSQNTIEAVIQDKHGFIWIATQSGLNKYDGNKFTIFNTSNSDAPLSHNNITSLFEFDDKIIIGTKGGGLNILDQKTNSVKIYKSDPFREFSIPDNTVYSVFVDSKKNCWIGTSAGLCKFDSKTERFTLLSTLYPDKKELLADIVNTFKEDNQNNLYIGSTKHGVYKINLLSNKISSLFSSNQFILSSKNITSISLISNNIILISTLGDGLFEYDLEKKNYKIIQSINKISIPKNITDVLKCENECYWIASWTGLYRLNYESKNISKFFVDEHSRNFLLSQSITTLFKDKGNVVWIGTNGKGIHYYHETENQFTTIQHDESSSISLVDNGVFSLMTDKEGLIWIGTFGGLDILDLKNNKLINFEKTYSKLSNSQIWALFQDSDDRIWIGTSSGVFIFNKRSNYLKHIMFDESNPLSPTNRVIAIDEGVDKNIWIGTYSGIQVFNSELDLVKTFHHSTEDLNSIGENIIRCFYTDINNQLWVGTTSGLNKYNRHLNNFERISFISEDSTICNEITIYKIIEKDSDYLWLATSEGLIVVNKSNYNTKRIQFDKNIHDTFFTFILDKKSNLWLGSNQGLIRYDFVENKSLRFSETNGLQNDEFNTASTITNDGRIILGGVNGMNIIDPDNFSVNTFLPPLQITNILVNDKPIKNLKNFSKTHEINPSYITDIVLQPDENNVAFEFAALSFLESNKNTYKYQLVNFDDDWVNNGNRNLVNYTNLNSGEYVFKVIYGNNMGFWNNDPRTIKITITPYIYETTWFRIIIGIIFISIIIMIFYLRSRLYEKQNKKLESLIEDKTNKLVEKNFEIQTAQLELEQEKENLTITLGSINEGVIRTDLNGIIQFSNSPAISILMAEYSNLNGKSFFKQIVDRTNDEEFKKLLEELKENPITITKVSSKNLSFSNENGEATVVILNGNMVCDKDEELCGYVFVLQDITNRIKIENQLAVSQKMESIGQLAAGIAHEINTPLQYVGDNLTFLREVYSTYQQYSISLENALLETTKNDEKVRANLNELKEKYDLEFLINEIPSALQQSVQGVDKASKIIKTLKEFSVNDENIKSMHNLNSAIESCIEIAKAEWQKEADLNIELDPNLPMIRFSQAEINQVLLNLILNATQAIEVRKHESDLKQGNILISTMMDEDSAIIKVVDNGNGISEENLNRIYDPFFTTKDIGEGTGQGLSVVHDIVVNKHKGSITVDSLVGKGTTFTLKLPLISTERELNET